VVWLVVNRSFVRFVVTFCYVCSFSFVRLVPRSVVGWIVRSFVLVCVPCSFPTFCCWRCLRFWLFWLRWLRLLRCFVYSRFVQFVRCLVRSLFRVGFPALVRLPTSPTVVVSWLGSFPGSGWFAWFPYLHVWLLVVHVCYTYVRSRFPFQVVRYFGYVVNTPSYVRLIAFVGGRSFTLVYVRCSGRSRSVPVYGYVIHVCCWLVRGCV